MAVTPRKLKVAVVGAGFAHSPDGRERFAVRTHIPALLALPDLFEVVATCTTHMTTARESADHFGIPHAFDSVERMVDELPDLDVVCVSVRPAYHHQVAMPAPQSYYRVSGIDEQKGVFCIAQTWAAFHDAIVNDHQCRPNFEDGLRIHRLLDAGNESSRSRAWVDADFSGI